VFRMSAEMHRVLTEKRPVEVEEPGRAESCRCRKKK
jgi:hypothetical protein